MLDEKKKKTLRVAQVKMIQKIQNQNLKVKAKKTSIQ